MPAQFTTEMDLTFLRLQETLEEREETYPRFEDIAVLSSTMRRAWEDEFRINSKGTYTPRAAQVVEEGVVMILHKLSRIACGWPSPDHLLDVAGYALRILEALEQGEGGSK